MYLYVPRFPLEKLILERRYAKIDDDLIITWGSMLFEKRVVKKQ